MYQTKQVKHTEPNMYGSKKMQNKKMMSMMSKMDSKKKSKVKIKKTGKKK
jgi:hypothetical protein